jgi:transcriptional regulator with XRE-family HTH domain
MKSGIESSPGRLLTKSCNNPTVVAKGLQATSEPGMLMQFGERVRELRLAKNLTIRELAKKLEVNFTYVSKIENQKLSFGEYPSEDLIRKIAKTLGGDGDELLILAEKIPKQIKKRVMERPDAFRKIAQLDDKTLDKILEELGDD